jgi:hypothetical protein
MAAAAEGQATQCSPEGASVSRRSLPILTQSSLTCFRRCPREYYFRYVELIKPRRKAEALRFGSLFHSALNAWWLPDDVRTSRAPSGLSSSARLFLAVDAIQRGEETDPFDIAKAHALLIGYTARWGDEKYKTIAVEKRFEMQVDECLARTGACGCPKCEPENEGLGNLRGSIDAIVARKLPRDRTDIIRTEVYNVEHKTTSADISPGSDYWRHVIALDAQVSTYNAATKAMGYDICGTIYDVIRKPEMIPLKATPEDMRKYTKPTKAEPVPRLYANQRETDETPDEYRDRIIKDIEARPNWYFARHTIVRLDRDDEEHARDVVQTAEMIRFAEERSAWPRSPNACERYRRYCDFHPVCSGECSIADGTRYEKKTAQHEELT